MPIQVNPPAKSQYDADKATAGTNPIDNITLAQALTYLQNNVTDLASAKVYLAKLTAKTFLLERRLAVLEAFVQTYTKTLHGE